MKTINSLALLLLSISFFSCEDILEEDITNDTIQIIAPQNGQVITSNVVNFQWNTLDGADDYRIQVFETGEGTVLDSLVSQNNFSFPINPGNYQWRVRGENFAYTSSYSFNSSFSVIQSNDLTTQQVVLNNPADSFYTNNTNIILNWQTLTAATSYSFELINVTNGNNVVNQQNGLTSNSITLSNVILSQDAEYSWKIKAVNNSSQTNFSSRKFFLDTVNPNQPFNLLPSNNATFNTNQTINFSWSIPPDSGTITSPITYTIEFSNTNTFSSIFLTFNTTQLSQQQVFTTTGEYYWRIKAKDQANNSSVFSNTFHFTIN